MVIPLLIKKLKEFSKDFGDVHFRSKKRSLKLIFCLTFQYMLE